MTIRIIKLNLNKDPVILYQMIHLTWNTTVVTMISSECLDVTADKSLVSRFVECLDLTTTKA